MQILLHLLVKFLRGDKRFVQIFTKFDKLNVSEQNKLKATFPNALFSSSLNKQNTPKIADFIVANALGYAL